MAATRSQPANAVKAQQPEAPTPLTDTGNPELKDFKLSNVEEQIAKEEAAEKAGTVAISNPSEGEGIVYERTNPETGEQYVGQTKSPKRFEARQGEHNRDLGVQHRFKIIGRAKPGRELDTLEETKIREYGGLKKLRNKRHQMSEQRYSEAGGTVKNPDRK